MNSSHTESQASPMANFESLFAETAKDGPLARVKDKAWDHFLELGLPDPRKEAYRKVRLRELLNMSFSLPKMAEISAQDLDAAILEECQGSCLVFVNGHFCQESSRTSSLPKSLVLAPLGKAMKTYGALIQGHWAKEMKRESDPFATLNAALHPEGVFIYCPPKQQVETPIQILHVITREAEGSLLSPRTQVFVGQEGKVDFCLSVLNQGCEQFWSNGCTDFIIEKGARSRLVNLSEVPPSAWHFEYFRAKQARDSSFKVTDFNVGSKIVVRDYRVLLEGENAEAELNGAWMLSDRNQSQSAVFMEHAAPNCRSSQLFKGMVSGLGHSNFEGKIYVHPVAQQTDAFQANHNLVLGDKAQADSKPGLEIFADDVKASHGATVGQPDPEELFYLQSRGLSPQAAQKLLVAGFCEEVLETIPYKTIREKVMDLAYEAVNAQ